MIFESKYTIDCVSQYKDVYHSFQKFFQIVVHQIRSDGLLDWDLND